MELVWAWNWFGPGTIQPNDIGIVSRLQDRDYIYIKRDGLESSEVGGFHWECFRKADATQEDRLETVYSVSTESILIRQRAVIPRRRYL